MAGIRTAVIGCGNMGTAHCTCLHRGEAGGLCLTAVCDVDGERRALLQARFPDAAVYGDYREMLEKEPLEAVIIATPHPLHAQIAVECLKHGLHIMVEKPVDIAVSRAEALNRAAEKSGRVFGVMFNQRTNPLFRTCRDMVRGGELGEIKRATWLITNWYRTQAYYDSGTWRATWAGEGGGVLLNQAPHNLDLWQWILGMPRTVTAFCETAKYHRIEVEDEATLITQYENGATGIFVTSTGEYPGVNQLEIVGTRGRMVLEGGKLRFWALSEDERTVCFASRDGFVQIPTTYREIEQTEPESAHPGILRDFARAIETGTPLLAPGEEAINELTLSNAAYLSQWTGNRSVKLPMDTAQFDALLAERQAVCAPEKAPQSEKLNDSYHPRWQVRW